MARVVLVGDDDRRHRHGEPREHEPHALQAQDERQHRKLDRRTEHAQFLQTTLEARRRRTARTQAPQGRAHICIEQICELTTRSIDRDFDDPRCDEGRRRGGQRRERGAALLPRDGDERKQREGQRGQLQLHGCGR